MYLPWDRREGQVVGDGAEEGEAEMNEAQEKLERQVARAICEACDEDPDAQGDCQGNDYRWEDYIKAASAAIEAMWSSE